MTRAISFNMFTHVILSYSKIFYTDYTIKINDDKILGNNKK